MMLAISIFMEIQRNEILQFQGLAGDRVRVVLLNIGYDVCDFVHDSIVSANRVFKWSKRDGAAIEGQSLIRQVAFALETPKLCFPLSC